jgi:Uma2 family endonuclease
MTTEELLALPEDGVDRELIRGQLREKPVTRRDRWHSRVEATSVHFLGSWLDTQPEPRGQVVSGEAGFRLRRDPDSTVGIDVAYISAEVAAVNADAVYFDGPPVLAVEILSPSDKQEEIDEKVELYLETGVAIIWIVNPRLKTVCVYRPGADPEMFNERHELTAEPHLPGFRVKVARLFAS